MAKGQRKSNREIRKPKKSAAEKSTGAEGSTVSSIFATPSKSDAKPKKR